MPDTEAERVVKALTAAEKRALEYHAREDRGASCGNMGTDLSLVFAGLADFGKDGRLTLTDAGRAALQPPPAASATKEPTP